MNFLDLQDLILDSTKVRIFINNEEYILNNKTLKNFKSKLLTNRIKSISTIPIDTNECYLNIECDE